MKSMILPLSILLLAVIANMVPAQNPTADEIIEMHLDAMGGEAALRDVESIVTQANMLIPTPNGDLESSMVQYQSGNRFYMEMDIPSVGMVTRGSDGEIFWSIDPFQGARILDGTELEAAKQQFANSFPALTWKNFDGEIKVGSKERIEGNTAYKVTFDPTNGEEVTRYFDVETGHILKIETIQKDVVEMTVEVFPSNYVEVNGVTLPHKQVTSSAAGDMIMEITKLRLNPEIAPEKFALPEQIREILKDKDNDKERSQRKVLRLFIKSTPQAIHQTSPRHQTI